MSLPTNHPVSPVSLFLLLPLRFLLSLLSPSDHLDMRIHQVSPKIYQKRFLTSFFKTLEPLWKSDLHCTQVSATVATLAYQIGQDYDKVQNSNGIGGYIGWVGTDLILRGWSFDQNDHDVQNIYGTGVESTLWIKGDWLVIVHILLWLGNQSEDKMQNIYCTLTGGDIGWWVSNSSNSIVKSK